MNSYLRMLLAAVSLLILTLVFFLTEKREEYLKEEVFWKVNPDKIIYHPPSKDFAEKFQDFSQVQLTIEKHNVSLKVPPIFTVTGIDPTSNTTFVYEGGYNVKNLFTELSVLRIKSIHIIEDELLKKMDLSLKDSPRIEMYKNDKLVKAIFMGNVKSNLRRIVADNYILTTLNHPFDKFRGSIAKFRERQVFHPGQYYIQKVFYKAESQNIHIENEPNEYKEPIGNVWYKYDGKKMKIDPLFGNEMLRILKSLNIALFPDEPDGQGFEIAKILLDAQTNQEIEIFTSDGIDYHLKFYPPVDILNKRYIPCKRVIKNIFQESVVYVREEDLGKLFNSFNTIQKAKEYVEPKHQKPKELQKK
ncbi:MAG: hypothetical protein H7A23_22715 [Leptospiraceae bacterium]|nr:hypothetical protein [Leptospiraceae bacterium]MCP5497377.1 hypothetical protein [Leptospiraceae bacterium]